MTVRRRFLLLGALRWLPTGLLMPVLVLLLLQRGLTAGQVGLCLGVQAVVVLVLELPTGGAADSRGRRPVLLAASLVDVVSISVLAVADSLLLVVGVFVLQGVYRALESGPLEAWYVDTAQALDPEVDIDSALAASGTVTGLSIALGAITSSAAVALHVVSSIDPLLLPVLLAIAVRALDVAAISMLMTEPDQPRSAPPTGAREVIRSTLALIRGSNTLVMLLAAEGLWGAGIVAFETFTPPRLEAVLADPTDVAALLGPAPAAAWLLAGLSAAAAPTLARRYGAERVGAALRVAQGATVAGVAVMAGPVGILTAYLATMAVHGASNPIHQTLLHRAVPGSHGRTTVLSANSLTGNLGAAGEAVDREHGGAANSLTGNLGAAVGGIGLGLLADATTLSVAMLTGAAVLATAAPLYLRIAPSRHHAPTPAQG